MWIKIQLSQKNIIRTSNDTTKLQNKHQNKQADQGTTWVEPELTVTDSN